MTEIYRPKVFRHGGLGSDMFLGLVVGVGEVIMEGVITCLPKNLITALTCLHA